MRHERKTVQDVFIRVCRDSGYSMNAIKAAGVAAAAMKCHPLDVWLAMPSLYVMDEIAAGTHPACRVH
jgi:hypothetical protein